jgi:hypothetical protein
MHMQLHFDLFLLRRESELHLQIGTNYCRDSALKIFNNSIEVLVHIRRITSWEIGCAANTISENCLICYSHSKFYIFNYYIGIDLNRKF